MPEFVQLHPGGHWHRPSINDDDFTVCGVPILSRHAVTHADAVPSPACAHPDCSTVPLNPLRPRLDSLSRGLSGSALPRSRRTLRS